MTTETLAVYARVQLGAALLDQYVPGWEGRVDPQMLNMANGTRCVLAQVFGAVYSYGLSVLFMLANRLFPPSDYGFNTPVPAQYEMLTNMWHDEIRTRKAAAA